MKINIQPIEKKVEGDGETLDVRSIFFTIQGEGPYTGRPAVFIRLAGCNLQCPGCDTEYTEGRETLSMQEIGNRVREVLKDKITNYLPLIVITGGEPFRQNLKHLIAIYAHWGKIQIETNGTYDVDAMGWAHLVDIVCSPKSGKVHHSVAHRAKCYKYVLHHASVSEQDGLPILALDHSASPQIARPPFDTPVYVQPMDCQDEETNRLNLQAALASCMKFGYTLQLQTHKLLGVE